MGKKKDTKKKKRSQKRDQHSAGGRSQNLSNHTAREEKTVHPLGADSERATEADTQQQGTPGNHIPRLIDRYLDTLEGQLRVKDDQIRSMDERLQDAFDMQRALALLVKAYERRTGLSAETVWDAVSDSELAERDRSPGKSSAESAAPINATDEAFANNQGQNDVASSPRQADAPSAATSAATSAAPSAATSTAPNAAPSTESPAGSPARGAFTYWLRQAT